MSQGDFRNASFGSVSPEELRARMRKVEEEIRRASKPERLLDEATPEDVHMSVEQNGRITDVNRVGAARKYNVRYEDVTDAMFMEYTRWQRGSTSTDNSSPFGWGYRGL